MKNDFVGTAVLLAKRKLIIIMAVLDVACVIRQLLWL